MTIRLLGTEPKRTSSQYLWMVGKSRCFGQGRFPDDLDADEASAAAGQRLAMPVLALWGDSGLLSRLPVLDIWRGYADDVRGQAVAGCGHFLPEERPDEVAGQLLAFLGA